MPPHVLYVLGDPAALDTPSRRRRRRDEASDRSRQGRCVAPGRRTWPRSGHASCRGSRSASTARPMPRHSTPAARPSRSSGRATRPSIPAPTRRWPTGSSPQAAPIVSELGPDVVPTKGTFPRRNRIISGLADATVVVEAPARSGALITASWALEQGRDCYLVPGAIDAPASAGCLAFLREFRARARGSWPASRSSSTTSVWPTTWPKRASARRPRRHSPMSARPRADWGASSCSDGTPSTSSSRSPAGRSRRVLAGLTLLERRGLAVGVHGRFRPAPSPGWIRDRTTAPATAPKGSGPDPS